jgi:hypothetical protein
MEERERKKSVLFNEFTNKRPFELTALLSKEAKYISVSTFYAATAILQSYVSTDYTKC